MASRGGATYVEDGCSHDPAIGPGDGGAETGWSAGDGLGPLHPFPQRLVAHAELAGHP
jgi:hypothetical protein